MKTGLKFNDIKTKTLLNKHTLFIGVEVEGRFSGKKTLFVKHFSEVPNSRIIEAAREHKVEQIYLGAGSTKIKSFKKIEALQVMLQHDFFIVSCEVQQSELAKVFPINGVHFILNIPLLTVPSIKIIDTRLKNIYVYPLGTPVITPFNHPLFSADTPLE